MASVGLDATYLKEAPKKPKQPKKKIEKKTETATTLDNPPEITEVS